MNGITLEHGAGRAGGRCAIVGDPAPGRHASPWSGAVPRCHGRVAARLQRLPLAADEPLPGHRYPGLSVAVIEPAERCRKRLASTLPIGVRPMSSLGATLASTPIET